MTIRIATGTSPLRRLALAGIGASLALAFTLAPTVLAADHAVTIVNFAFDPSSTTIAVGDSVTWTNQDDVAHTADADDGSWQTGQLSNGQGGSVTFDTAGTFAYHCDLHPRMTGTIVVAASGAPQTSTESRPEERPPFGLALVALIGVAGLALVGRRAGPARRD